MVCCRLFKFNRWTLENGCTTRCPDDFHPTPSCPQKKKCRRGPRGLRGQRGEKGEKGDKGDTGLQGIQGEKGEKGDTGPQGIQGEKGDKGDTGPQGIQGEKGDKGDTGPQGIQGEKGDKGDTGPQGIQGEKGEKGDTGPQGIQGPAGVGEVELVFTVMDMYKNGNTPISKFPNTLYPNASTPPNPASEGGAIAAWGLTLNSTTDTVNVEFKIPNTYVATSPLIVNAHILLEKKGFVSGNIQLRLRADYRGNAEEWGQGTANINYKQTVTSPVTAVAEPTGADKQNSARHYRLQFTLPQGVAAPEDWAFFSIDRVSLASGNYTGPIYLSVISVRYATS